MITVMQPFRVSGLYYAGVENNIMAERAFNEANRINEPGVTQSKSYVSCDVEKEPGEHSLHY